MTNVPHDLDAEAHVIGACMIVPRAIADTSAVVTSADFYRPANAATYAAIVDLWSNGHPVDARTVLSKLKGEGLTAVELNDAIGNVPATSHAARYASIVVEHAARRRLIALASELTNAALGHGDPAELIDTARAGLEAVDLPAGRVPDDLGVLDDLLDAPVEARAPWVVPGLLRRDWRVIVVAPEGQGKTALLFQVAICAAQGVHPLTYQPVDPIRVLIVDLENPEERIVHGSLPIRDATRARAAAYDRDRIWLWHRPGGIDLRARADVAAFEAVLAKVRPDLVVMGPAYKASQRGKGEGWDESAAAVQRVLDGLRTRFSFALLMEDHAPQSSGAGVRDLRPFGSSLWLRWPEIGLKLAPESEPPAARVLVLKRWRGDRLPNDWPTRLEEAGTWPWAGVWEDGMPNYSRGPDCVTAEAV